MEPRLEKINKSKRNMSICVVCLGKRTLGAVGLLVQKWRHDLIIMCLGVGRKKSPRWLVYLSGWGGVTDNRKNVNLISVHHSLCCDGKQYLTSLPPSHNLSVPCLPSLRPMESRCFRQQYRILLDDISLNWVGYFPKVTEIFWYPTLKCLL